jgi:hypothetical protein
VTRTTGLKVRRNFCTQNGVGVDGFAFTQTVAAVPVIKESIRFFNVTTRTLKDHPHTHGVCLVLLTQLTHTSTRQCNL